LRNKCHEKQHKTKAAHPWDVPHHCSLLSLYRQQRNVVELFRFADELI
jgi:hypothetical protein